MSATLGPACWPTIVEPGFGSLQWPSSEVAALAGGEERRRHNGCRDLRGSWRYWGVAEDRRGALT